MISKRDILIEEMSELTRALIKEKRYVSNDLSLTWTKEEIEENIKEEFVQVQLLLNDIFNEIFEDVNEYGKLINIELRKRENRGLL